MRADPAQALHEAAIAVAHLAAEVVNRASVSIDRATDETMYVVPIDVLGDLRAAVEAWTNAGDQALLSLRGGRIDEGTDAGEARIRSLQLPAAVDGSDGVSWIQSFERPPLNMTACPARLGTTEPAGIPVPAVVEGKVAEVDLAELDEESLVDLLRVNGGAWMERLVCHLLGWPEHAPARKLGSALKRLRQNRFLGNLFLLEVDPDHRSGRGRWWRANRSGYTDLVSQAGLYGVDETDEQDCRPRSVADVLTELEEPIRALRERAAERFVNAAGCRARFTTTYGESGTRHRFCMREAGHTGDHRGACGTQWNTGVADAPGDTGDAPHPCWRPAVEEKIVF